MLFNDISTIYKAQLKKTIKSEFPNPGPVSRENVIPIKINLI